MKGTFAAVDGINGGLLLARARARVAEAPRARRGGVSEWDASGIFGDLVVADASAGHVSARTLLLLYAADLKFRLRWEILPALEKGKFVAAAPYVTTAAAFGRAAGLEREWIENLFLFAPAPDVVEVLDGGPARDKADRAGFIEFGCDRLGDGPGGPRRTPLREAIVAYLRRAPRARRR
jgi:hypothetical protein